MADQPASNSAKGGGDPFNMVKALRAKQNSETGSANGGSGSDNSALVSFGNNSFGFNFDSEEGTRPDSEKNDSSSDNEVTNIMNSKVPATVSSASTGARSSQAGKSPKSSISSLTNSSGGGGKSDGDMAASASSNLKSIATLCMQQGAKRKAADNDSGGYNTDDDDDQAAKVGSQAAASSSARSSKDSVSSDLSSPKGKKKRRLDKDKREERNAREKERSFRISKQINELRDLLSSGGVIVPKGTKSSVLTEAANYIRTLQQHHYRSEMYVWLLWHSLCSLLFMTKNSPFVYTQ